MFDQHIPRPSFTWTDEPKHSLGSPLVLQVGFAILKFPHLAGVEHLMLKGLDQREPQAAGPALKIILLQLILAVTDACV